MVASGRPVFVGMIAMFLSIISMVIVARTKSDGESGGGLGCHGGGGGDGFGRGGCNGRRWGESYEGADHAGNDNGNGTYGGGSDGTSDMDMIYNAPSSWKEYF